MAQYQENNSSSSASIEGPVRYGELTVLGYNDFLPNGDKARTESHFTLCQRATANGLKPSTVHKDCNPQEVKAISISNQHSVSYTHSVISTTVVKYAPDNDTDMFQIGRSTESPIDFVVTETEADSQTPPISTSPISRFACRIICQRSPPYTARIYAAGFDRSKKIILGVSALKWTTRDGQMDGLTTNGVLVLHPPHVSTQEPGLWREISVCGNVFTFRNTQSERGEMVDSESQELVDGSLIDLCGVTLQWRTAEGLARTPTMQHLEVQRGLELYPGRPCFVYKVLINRIYAGSLGDLTSDAKDYADSWCRTVEPGFRKKQDTREVQRQNVIYELMQTERNHLERLLVMDTVFRRGLRYEVQLDAEALERLFPCLDQLVLLHHALFRAMKERRHSSAQPPGHSSTQTPGHSNYLIQQIGDILLKQFSDEKAQRMKQAYGEFCSHQNEAVSFYKELMLNNKDFQDFIKNQRHLRKLEIPDVILLVTQRITKYPLLLESILRHTQEDTEEHADTVRALVHMREVISAVDLRVSEYEQDQPLRDALNSMENSSSAKLKNGLAAFRKQNLAGQRRKYHGRLQLKTANGRLKDVLVLLFSDTLIFLQQEKNQKYTFATVDEKHPVVSLQELRVTKVANEERGMNLIRESGAGAQVYEVLTSAQYERNTWMRLITEAMVCKRKDHQSSQDQDC